MKELKFILRKTPRMIPYFQKFIDTEKVKIENIEKIYVKIRDHKQLFPALFEKNQFDRFETLCDFIENKIIDSQKRSFVKQFVSNKYKHLINDETVELFNIIKKEFQIKGYSEVNNLVMKKVALYKNATDFNSYIISVITSLGGEWNIIGLESKIKKADATILYKDDSTILCDIPYYSCMKLLGSENWCIKRSSSFWNDYMRSDILGESFRVNRQLILFDLNYNQSDYRSMVGITVEPSGNIRAAHYKNDQSAMYEINEYIKKYPIRFYDLKEKAWKDRNMTLKLSAYFGDLDKIKKSWFLRYFSDKQQILDFAIAGGSENSEEIVKFMFDKHGSKLFKSKSSFEYLIESLDGAKFNTNLTDYFYNRLDKKDFTFENFNLVLKKCNSEDTMQIAELFSKKINFNSGTFDSIYYDLIKYDHIKVNSANIGNNISKNLKFEKDSIIHRSVLLASTYDISKYFDYLKENNTTSFETLFSLLIVRMVQDKEDVEDVVKIYNLFDRYQSLIFNTPTNLLINIYLNYDLDDAKRLIDTLNIIFRIENDSYFEPISIEKIDQLLNIGYTNFGHKFYNNIVNSISRQINQYDNNMDLVDKVEYFKTRLSKYNPNKREEQIIRDTVPNNSIEYFVEYFIKNGYDKTNSILPSILSNIEGLTVIYNSDYYHMKIESIMKVINDSDFHTLLKGLPTKGNVLQMFINTFKKDYKQYCVDKNIKDIIFPETVSAKLSSIFNVTYTNIYNEIVDNNYNFTFMHPIVIKNSWYI